MSSDSDEYELGSLEKEVIDKFPELSKEEVLELSEPEYREYILRQEKNMTKPMIHSIENSIGRERKRLEDWYQNESGADKWVEIWSCIGPRWAHVIAELDQRTEKMPGLVKPIEEKYRNQLEEDFIKAQNLSTGLEAKYVLEDRISEFVSNYRALEDIYQEKVHPNITPEDL